MYFPQRNATITSLAGTAVNIPAYLIPLTLEKSSAILSTAGISVTAKLYFPNNIAPPNTLPANITVNGQNYEIVRVRIGIGLRMYSQAYLNQL